MIRTQMTMGAVLLACFLWSHPGPVQAERVTTVGNAGTITLEWQVTQNRAGRALITGRVITYGGKAGYCRSRLLVETLDAQGQVTARNVGFIPGYVGGYDNVYFEEPIRTPGAAYRVSIASWDRCGGGAQ
jgi:hypothetical protein